MSDFNLYKDIATRTNGDIYIGVVGPVRTGKSTFIKKFMEEVVLDNIDDNSKNRAIDELPQSANGKTIMTTEPKFVPNEAIKVKFNDKISCKLRMIDCVGYMVEGALGDKEDGLDRLVSTPWSEEKIPFSKASEIGTKKVINEHSTIGMLVTTDGSFSDIDRASYLPVEERVVNELKSLNKPFVIVLNCKEVNEQAQTLRNELSSRYQAPVIAKNVLNLTREDILEIMEEMVYEFPITKIEVKMPKFMQSLEIDNPIIAEIIDRLKVAFNGVTKMSDATSMENIFSQSEYIKDVAYDLDMGTGIVTATLKPIDNLFYKVLSAECEKEIVDDFDLVSYIKYLSNIEKQYSGLSSAIESVNQNGYGIVYPNAIEIELSKPEIVKKGGNYGVKIKAKTKSMHLMNIPIEAEVAPIVGDLKQANDLLDTMVEQFETNKEELLQTNLFGKSLIDLLKEGIESKLNNMPSDVKIKMKKTISKIINDGKGGVICILL